MKSDFSNLKSNNYKEQKIILRDFHGVQDEALGTDWQS